MYVYISTYVLVKRIVSREGGSAVVCWVGCSFRFPRSKSSPKMIAHRSEMTPLSLNMKSISVLICVANIMIMIYSANS